MYRDHSSRNQIQSIRQGDTVDPVRDGRDSPSEPTSLSIMACPDEASLASASPPASGLSLGRAATAVLRGNIQTWTRPRWIGMSLYLNFGSCRLGLASFLKVLLGDVTNSARSTAAPQDQKRSSVSALRAGTLLGHAILRPPRCSASSSLQASRLRFASPVSDSLATDIT